VGNRLSEFSPRDVQRNVHCFRHAEELRPALKMLAERGYVREATVAGEAGKTRKTWQVNPILYAEDRGGAGGAASVTSARPALCGRGLPRLSSPAAVLPAGEECRDAMPQR
jgi:hypothetical protein